MGPACSFHPHDPQTKQQKLVQNSCKLPSMFLGHPECQKTWVLCKPPKKSSSKEPRVHPYLIWPYSMVAPIKKCGFYEEPLHPQKRPVSFTLKFASCAEFSSRSATAPMPQWPEIENSWGRITGPTVQPENGGVTKQGPQNRHAFFGSDVYAHAPIAF